MDIKKLSNDELLASFENQLEIERRASHLSLLHLKEIRTRRLYADRGFENLFEMLITYFRLSESSANQRLKALDLMLAVPEVEEGLKNGDVNLSTLAMAQRQIKREEKITGQKIDNKKKAEIVESITNKTQAQAEIELMRILPESATAPETHERRVSEDATRVALTLPDRVRDKLLQLKNIWAHVDAEMDYVQIIERAADIALKKVDPVQRPEKKTSEEQCATDRRSDSKAGQRPNYYSVVTDRALWERAGSQCEFVDEVSGRRCSCKFGLQRDHIIAIALGGSNELSNMRLLCQTHNLLMARRHFGDEKIDAEIRRRNSSSRC